MATRKRRARTTTRRRATSRRSISPRRRVRRRRNPSVAFAPVAIAGLVGAGAAAAAYAADGIPKLTNRHKALALLIGGAVGGLAVSMVNPAIGAALAAGGVGLGAYGLIGTMQTGSTATAEAAGAKTATTTADAQVGALRSQLGALRAQLNGASGYPAGMGAVYDYSHG